MKRRNLLSGGYHFTSTDANTLTGNAGNQLRGYTIYGQSVQFCEYDIPPDPEYPADISALGNLVTDDLSPHFGKYEIDIYTGEDNLYDNSYPYNLGTMPEAFMNKANYATSSKKSYIGNQSYIYWLARMKNTDGIAILPKGGLLLYDQNGIYSSRTEISNYTTLYRKTTTSASKAYCSPTLSVIYSHLGQFDNMIGDACEKLENCFFLITPNEPTYQKIYLDSPLRGIGNHRDYIDFTTQTRYTAIGHIDEYAGESITTDYLAYSGSLVEGEEVDYVLPEPVIEHIELPPITCSPGNPEIFVLNFVQPSEAVWQYYKY